ncbi:hypothetical protein OsJ_28041 [Oryza sativa Japonica Group]|uniref:Uncharacterized protein n=1 Tax=Oryza sativa subsp. japonica TaxID=39947 RepID=B9G1X6_ORYSJ|nr:hypothetical protein OsJ_28041 [Oryza sativa Japonica Group]BAD09012.1 hypothetical protein [Oryza sativa Japonica Group]BAD09111.1 hypothetical protein [Oryza sativa Japonica Group]
MAGSGLWGTGSASLHLPAVAKDKAGGGFVARPVHVAPRSESPRRKEGLTAGESSGGSEVGGRSGGGQLGFRHPRAARARATGGENIREVL